MDRRASIFDEFDARHDAVWMAEVQQEATHVWCHKQRIAMFFSAMRHFRDELRDRNVNVHYHALGTKASRDRGKDLATVLGKDIGRLRPERLKLVHPGDYRVKNSLRAECGRMGVPLDILPDNHFYCQPEEFEEYAHGRKSLLLLESFYRRMRNNHNMLMDGDEATAQTIRPLDYRREPVRRRDRLLAGMVQAVACRPGVCLLKATGREDQQWQERHP